MSEVTGLRTVLENQIQESNRHHQEEVVELERKVEELQSLLEQEQLKIDELNRENEEVSSPYVKRHTAIC